MDSRSFPVWIEAALKIESDLNLSREMATNPSTKPNNRYQREIHLILFRFILFILQQLFNRFQSQSSESHQLSNPNNISRCQPRGRVSAGVQGKALGQREGNQWETRLVRERCSIFQSLFLDGTKSDRWSKSCSGLGWMDGCNPHSHLILLYLLPSSSTLTYNEFKKDYHL